MRANAPLILGCLAACLGAGVLSGCTGYAGPAPEPLPPAVAAPPPVGPAGYPAPNYQPSYPQQGYQGQGYQGQAYPPSPYRAPTPSPAVAYGATCYAGFYTCALPASLPVGASCTCPGLGAPSYGTVR